MSGLRLSGGICSVWTSRCRIRANLITGCLGALPCGRKQTDDYTYTYQQYKRQQTFQSFPYRGDQYHNLLKPESNMFSRPIQQLTRGIPVALLNLFARRYNVADHLLCEKCPLEVLIHGDVSNFRVVCCPTLSSTTCLGWMSTTLVFISRVSPILTMCVLSPAVET